MVAGPSQETLRAIESSSVEEQVAALKEVKNDIVGHDQRKELVVQHGIVGVLVRILGSYRRAEHNTDGVPLEASGPWTPEDDARLQATLILGSLANGGPAFVDPLMAAGTHKVLLQGLSSFSAPPRLVTATLQTLKGLAASWSSRTRSASASRSSINCADGWGAAATAPTRTC